MKKNNDSFTGVYIALGFLVIGILVSLAWSALKFAAVVKWVFS